MACQKDLRIWSLFRQHRHHKADLMQLLTFQGVPLQLLLQVAWKPLKITPLGSEPSFIFVGLTPARRSFPKKNGYKTEDPTVPLCSDMFALWSSVYPFRHMQASRGRLNADSAGWCLAFPDTEASVFSRVGMGQFGVTYHGRSILPPPAQFPSPETE